MSGEPFPHLDKVIHERVRMAIMSLLAGTRDLSFVEIREELGLM